MTMLFRKAALLPTIPLFFVASCTPPQVEVRDVLKDEPSMTALSQISEGFLYRSRLEWDVPKTWEQLPSSALNIGNYVCKGAGGGKVEVTVSRLPQVTGIVERVINDFRSGIGLSEIDSVAMKENAQVIAVEGSQAHRYRIENAADPTQDYIELLTLNLEAYSWFFTMRGATIDAKSERGNFDQLIESITFSEALAPEAETETEDQIPQINFTIPDGWSYAENTEQRVASLAIVKPGLPVADFAILCFEGDERIHLANLNRWRSFLGLAAWTPNEANANRRFFASNHHQLTIYEFSASSRFPQRESILVALLVFDGHTWIFRLHGDALLVTTQESLFEQFLNSITFERKTPNLP